VVNSDYESQYVGAAEMAITKQGRRGWHVTPARRQHNIQRANQHRLEKGKETSQIREGLDAKLGVGLKEVADALNQIEAKLYWMVVREHARWGENPTPTGTRTRIPRPCSP
jgi:hypothetical protein